SYQIFPSFGPASDTLHAHGDAHAATDAEGCEALLRIAPLHLEKKRVEDARTGGTDRVAESDGAAVDVDLLRIPPEALVDGTGLGGERLVGLDEVEVRDRPAGLLQRLLGSRNGPGAHDGRVDARVRPRHDTGQRRDAPTFGLSQRHQHNGCSAVIDSGRIA